MKQCKRIQRVCAALMVLWTVEKKLPEEQEIIKSRKNEG